MAELPVGMVVQIGRQVDFTNPQKIQTNIPLGNRRIKVPAIGNVSANYEICAIVAHEGQTVRKLSLYAVPR